MLLAAEWACEFLAAHPPPFLVLSACQGFLILRSSLQGHSVLFKGKWSFREVFRPRFQRFWRPRGKSEWKREIRRRVPRQGLGPFSAFSVCTASLLSTEGRATSRACSLLAAECSLAGREAHPHAMTTLLGPTSQWPGCRKGSLHPALRALGVTPLDGCALQWAAARSPQHRAWVGASEPESRLCPGLTQEPPACSQKFQDLGCLGAACLVKLADSRDKEQTVHRVHRTETRPRLELPTSPPHGQMGRWERGLTHRRHRQGFGGGSVELN
ncbi:unnamed protein product [Rangifer tarandus platyrhynchus]|uniref:Uncharacterized protein n=1 Tax=Rangifer tarandus platyrhynchus TaxID=3082113 RepID=A0ABN8YZV1_RANTA|nr:unnamed protein product [Rangifer tarandus platyrhynchus]